MSNAGTCPKCGAPRAAGWAHDLCPACLAAAGLATATEGAAAPTLAMPPGTPPSLEQVRRLFPALEILALIGRGGMGVVYQARQPQLDRLVALKLLPADRAGSPGFAERFTREARALARLHHPHIVSVFDFGQVEGHFYLIMEYVDGANLRQLIASKQITPETALSIVPKVCEALQFAHDEGILHRDIKPENILIDKKGRVKIADFGLAKLVGEEVVDFSLTGTHQSMGTPRYMAPEQFESAKTVDHRADIYSLGVVFYEMLTGEIPMGRFVPPSKKVQVDVRIDEVVLRSLEREPAQRYQHVSEVKTDVENVTHHGAMASPPSPPKRDGGTPSLHTLPTTGYFGGANFQSLEESKGGGVGLIIAGGVIALVAFAAFYLGACNFEVYSKNKNTAFLIAFVSALGFSAGLAAVIAGIFRRKVERAWRAAVAVAGFTAAGVMLLWGFGANFTGPGVPPRTDMLVWLPYAFALIGSVVLLIKSPVNRSSGIPPETVLAALGVGIAALPWRGLEHLIPNPWSMACNSAWESSEGALFSLVYLALGFFLLITGGRKSQTILRASLLLLTGIIALGLLRHFATHPPPSNAPGGYGYMDHRFNTIYPSMIYQSNFMVAVITAFLTVLVGAIQLRNRLAAGSDVDSPAIPNDEPRLSRCALWGALIAPFGFCTLVASMLFLPPPNGPFAAWIHANYFTFVVVTSGVSLLGVAAILASMILGGIAVKQIKRSGGKIYGLRLAAASLLAHPLLVLGSLAFYITNLICFAIAFNLRTPVQPLPGATPERGLAVIDFAMIDSLAAFAVMFFAARFAWRSISGAANFQSSEKPLDHRVAEVVTTGIPGWFHARAKWVQSVVQTGLLLVSLVGLIALMGHRSTSRWEQRAGTHELALSVAHETGSPSPWLVYNRGPTGFNWAVHPLSSSARLGALGILAAILYERIRRSRPGFDAEKDRRTMRKSWIALGVVTVVIVAALAVVLSVKKRGRLPAGNVSAPSASAITSGFHVEFTVPAGQVAVFEVVTERNGGLVPVPPHCAYVRAPADSAVNGTLRWSRAEAQAGNGKRWRLEVVSGAGNGSTGGLLLADELDEAVGSSALTLGVLEPNKTAVHGGGPVRLRITTQAHNSQTGASGAATTDWRAAKVPAAGKPAAQNSTS